MISLPDSSAPSYNCDVIWRPTQNARSPLLQIRFLVIFSCKAASFLLWGARLTFNNLQMSLYEKCIQCGRCKIRFIIFWKSSTLQFSHWHSSRVWKFQSLGHWCIKQWQKRRRTWIDLSGQECLADCDRLSDNSWLLKWGLSNLAPHNITLTLTRPVRG